VSFGRVEGTFARGAFAPAGGGVEIEFGEEDAALGDAVMLVSKGARSLRWISRSVRERICIRDYYDAKSGWWKGLEFVRDRRIRITAEAQKFRRGVLRKRNPRAQARNRCGHKIRKSDQGWRR